jgi:methanogenic corrinoid protein MtbC1
MAQEALIERLFETLIAGDRPAARELARSAEQQLGSTRALVTELFWPSHQLLEKLYKSDQLSTFNHHAAVRLLRVLTDQAAARMTLAPRLGRSILAFCGPSENEELGAQMAVDVLESAGFSVVFAGAGIANDEIMLRVSESNPDILLAFCSAPQDLPNIRALIDSFRERDAAPGLQIAVGGGVFNRAEGLAEEIGADIWARSPMEMAETLIDLPTHRACDSQRTVGRSRRRKVA